MQLELGSMSSNLDARVYHSNESEYMYISSVNAECVVAKNFDQILIVIVAMYDAMFWVSELSDAAEKA
jgi:hypothetical protein